MNALAFTNQILNLFQDLKNLFENMFWFPKVLKQVQHKISF